MAVYNKNGAEITSVFSKAGASLQQAFDIHGNELLDEGGHRDWSKMPTTLATALDGSMAYIQGYIDTHPNSFAFPVITDVHTYFSFQEPNYIAWNKPDLFPVFLFLGDMTNGYVVDQLDGAVNYIQGATGQKLIVGVGNHDFGLTSAQWTDGDPLPREWWIPLLEKDCVFCEGDNTLTYYWDDAENNVRYIMLDSNSTVLKPSGVQLFAMSNLNWLASVLEASGGKDIIVLNHAPDGSFYLVTDTEKTTSQSSTGITNYRVFQAILQAFVGKTTYTITVSGEPFSYDFSKASGNLIGFITGHYHNAGHGDNNGFNRWTCNAVTRAGGTSKQYYKGLSFFIVDKDLRKVIFIVVRYQNAEFETYEYSY